jgi:hypothetical protein
MTETQWFRTAEGLVRLQVLKPFNFTVNAERARKFTAGEHLLDPSCAEDAAILAHPWIHKDFADGHIESPPRTKERLEAEAAAVEARADRQGLILKETAAALGLAP